MDDTLAQTKLYARLHDPAEKALVLLRDPAGHEGGSTRSLLADLFGNALPLDAKHWVKKADWWASAADRPQFPRAKRDGRFPRWAQVQFADKPVIKHPLTGEELNLHDSGGLADTDIAEIKAQSLRHFRSLTQTSESGDIDWQRTLLAYWRFGPEHRLSDDTTALGELWRRLPADTRIPDHTIWDHVDLASAFAGAFQADGNGRCALLHVALGPVQEFIATARSTSDLWAGSHLLARLSWEAMRVVCDRLGPDAILFPNLRGVPQVDLWLIESGLAPSLFDYEDWKRRVATDANPLFSASLPNRFLAIVPEDQAKAIAEAIQSHVRTWMHQTGRRVVTELLSIAALPGGEDVPAFAQLDEQLAGFPEVYWSAVDYDALTADSSDDGAVDSDALHEALLTIQGSASGTPGFLGSAAWRVLQRPVDLSDPEHGEAAVFYRPNPGVLFPAAYELGERIMGATKAVRPFDSLSQHGYRCSLTGETEWLTHDRDHLVLPPGQREQANTLWTRVGRERPALARKGEHLGALAAIKRLWPTLFCQDIRDVLGTERAPQRFVVSTHTMALSTSLLNGSVNTDALSDAVKHDIAAEAPAALPHSLAAQLRDRPDRDILHRLPTWLDRQRDEDDDAERTRRTAEAVLGKNPEAYYALVLMDGDSMGKWLSGDPAFAIPYGRAFHPDIRKQLADRFAGNQALQDYLSSPRAVSPGRHIAISSALNDFATVIARWIVEERHAGRILYAGGDDLMAMLPTADVLSAMRELRMAYSGHAPESLQDDGADWLGAGFVRRKGRIHLCMGSGATASMGAVVAHHQAPLLAVLQELKAAEQRAKRDGDRNAFSVSVLKRSGGALRYTGRWSTMVESGTDEMTTLREFAHALWSKPEASRRAAYHVNDWLTDLPEPASLPPTDGMQAYLASVLHYQFQRQGLEKADAPIHSRRLAALAQYSASGEPLTHATPIRERLSNLVGVAEFFARESRRPT
ncbi:type III-B CRISPR-associated protein Cas10/Cmr2 [Arhodomonas sp. AD133]|uniref:type III-B CRISPR-associated protein Cas10/Cmr2 n=1 Tax=Arhodomonas sp. AD133 TaxID=3415009 RepID=UPI003EC0F10B